MSSDYSLINRIYDIRKIVNGLKEMEQSRYKWLLDDDGPLVILSLMDRFWKQTKQNEKSPPLPLLIDHSVCHVPRRCLYKCMFSNLQMCELYYRLYWEFNDVKRYVPSNFSLERLPEEGFVFGFADK